MRLVKLVPSLSVLLAYLVGCVVGDRKLHNQDVHHLEPLNGSESVQLPLEPIYFGQYPRKAMFANGEHLPVNSNQEDAFYSVVQQNNGPTALAGQPMSEPMLLQSLGLDLARPIIMNQPQQALSTINSSPDEVRTSAGKPLVVSSQSPRAVAARSTFKVYRPKKLVQTYSPLKSVTMQQPPRPMQPTTQTLFSTKTTPSNSVPNKPTTRNVKATQIEELLQRLRPLSSGEIDPEDSDNELDQEEIQQLRREKKLKRVLPTSHLFGGSLGVVNESLLDNGSQREPNDLFSTDLSDDKELDALLSGVEQNSPSTGMDRDNLIDLGGLADAGSLSGASSNMAREVRSEPRRVHTTNSIDARNSIPIDLLVDHLMSNSRLARFDAQHGLQEPSANSENTGEFEDDDDEEGDDDQDNNDTLPSDSDSSESMTHETRVEAPKVSGSVTFSSIANRTDSWVPLKKIEALQPKQSRPDQVNGTKSKRRSRRERRGGLNLVVGNKVLSRMDLIRLIRILNRMASKREPSSEREASRKLLRFLVKLALDEHRKSRPTTIMGQGNQGSSSVNGAQERNKSAKDPIWDFFRSIVVSPESDPERENSSTTNRDLIELLPVQIPPRPKSDQSSQSGGSSAASIVDRTKLDKLSDDLEQYFDNDFYEDLADRTSARNNGSDRTWIQHRRELRSLPRRRRRPDRARRPGYRLPVPVYGRKDLDAADEDDVELDHVRLKKKAFRRRRDRDKQQARRIGRRRDQSTKNRDKLDSDDQSERDDEPDPDESDTDEQPVNSRKTRGETDEKSNASSRRRNQKVEKTGDEFTSDDEQQQADDDQVVNNANSSEPIAATSNHDDIDPLEEEKESKKRRKRRRKKRRKKVDDEVDLDSRDEIPAPIVAGRLASQSAAENETKFTEDVGFMDLESPNLDSENNDKSLVSRKKPKKKKKIAGKKLAKRDKPRGKVGKSRESNAGMKRKPFAKSPKVKNKALPKKSKDIKQEHKASGSNVKESPKRKARSSPRRTARKKKVLNEEEELDEEPKDMGDLDYYQEGTSYSRICDDNGKCKVKLESSSPKLGKAIKTGDKPMIERHLGQWMSEPD